MHTFGGAWSLGSAGRTWVRMCDTRGGELAKVTTQEGKTRECWKNLQGELPGCKNSWKPLGGPGLNWKKRRLQPSWLPTGTIGVANKGVLKE